MTMNKKISINMISIADSVKGQGVGSAYIEQVALIKDYASDLFDVSVNDLVGHHDINHFHNTTPDVFFRKLNKKTVTVIYCHFLPDTLEGSIKLPSIVMKAFSRYIVEIYKSADRLVVVNPCFKKELVKYGIRMEKIYYIPNYVSKDTFYPKQKEEINLIREKYGLKPDDFVVMGCGQVQTRKGVLDFAKVAKKCPNIQFIWAGGFSFGKITDGYDQLSKLVENPPENVHFLGIVEREEMNDIYNMSDLLFMPSYNELFPMTILEAVNVQKPILLRDLDLYKDILFKNYIKANNNEEFASFIQKFKEDSTFYQLGVDYSISISKYYSKEHVLSLWKQFYVDAYNEKNR